MSQTWSSVLAREKSAPYFQDILSFVNKQRAEGKTIFPEKQNTFNAFKYCDLSALKIVILGQDPYHNINQAHGLAFSVKKEVAIPPSLANIYKELKDDLNIETPPHGSLIDWAKQGVFLLNTVLTVQAHNAHSHANIGWERFTDKVIQKISENKQNVVFMLWGSHAQKKQPLIEKSKHCILTASHPSPLSAHRGFFGCKHFSTANHYLKENSLEAIDWRIH